VMLLNNQHRFSLRRDSSRGLAEDVGWAWERKAKPKPSCCSLLVRQASISACRFSLLSWCPL
jgi:hypothetical protein